VAQLATERIQQEGTTTGLSVVMPAFNEAESIRPVIERVLAELPGAELIVVDDGSRDGTAGQIADLPVQVVRHPYNKGNGAAVKSGIRAATGDWVLLLDADGQHSAEDVSELLRYRDDYDLVVGARPMDSQATWVRAAGNAALNRLASYVVGYEIPDLTSGFRLMRREAIREFLHLLPNGYSYPTTSTLCFFKAGYSVRFVPLRARRRTGGKSNMKLAKDGPRFLMIIFRILTLFSPLKLFLPISIALFVAGLLSAMYTIIFDRLHVPNTSVLLILAALIIFLMGLVSEQITALRFERREQ
jgi:glycosyltransferase involved in cell wall biosynthesis